MASERITLTIPGPDGEREVSLSSPNRVIWPEVGITKRELAEYAIAVAEPFLRANGHRPVSLERFPDSVDGESFFSKNPPKGAPDYVHEVMCTYNSGRRHPQVVLDEAAAIVWAIQMNTVVFHPWASLARDTDNPVELRIDLDPQPGTDFADAAAVAPALRDELREA
jgi:DNA primase